MMRYLIDTNAMIALIGRRSALLVKRVLQCREGEIALSVVVLHELYYGAYRSQRVSFNLETIRLAKQDFPMLALEEEDVRAAGEIRAALSLIGRPIGPFDVLIAGQAKARALTVITNNTGEFNRIDGLVVEDWTLA